MARPAMVISIAVVVALGALVLWLRAQATKATQRRETAIRQYDDMKAMRNRVQDLLRRAPKGGSETVDTSRIATFLSATASKVGLPSPKIIQTPSPKSGGWTEFASVIELTAGRDAVIARGPFIDFLSTVERERPYLKSRELSMSFAKDGPDLMGARAIISYFRRE